jgi:hypothetical protein
MAMPAPNRRTLARVAALTTAALTTAGLVLAGTPAGAVAPLAGPPIATQPMAGPPITAAPAAGTDDEGGTPGLRDQLDAAAKGYLAAQAALQNSTKRQKELGTHLEALAAEVTTRSGTMGELAGVAYRTGRLGPISALLASESPDGFLDRAVALTQVANNENRQLRALLDTRARETRAKVALEAEMREQHKQLDVMAKRKQQAERALTLAGGGGASAGVSGTGGGLARPAPRNADGSWPSESCSVNDPTTSGCITPRTLHAMNEAKAAGFTHFVSCHRNGGSGEHPKGRACDFAAAKGGFGGIATGADKTYGNNLAAYFIRNASRLGVLYVIWFKQIWLPGSGWKAYQSGNGDPSSDHTNHVHLSVV